MGQYFLIVNTNKKQYLDPHKFHNGAKLPEIIGSFGISNALVYLLSRSNGDGGAVMTVDFCKEMIEWIKPLLEDAKTKNKANGGFDSVKYYSDIIKGYKKQLAIAKKIKYLGTWIGDHVVTIGDYDELDLNSKAEKEFEDISEKVMAEVKEQLDIDLDENEHYKQGSPTLRPDMVLGVN